MENERMSRRKPLSLVGPVVFLGLAGAAGCWLWLAKGDRVQGLLAATALALTVISGVIWQWYVRAGRRRQAALDAYAEREIARAFDRRSESAKRAHSGRNFHARPQSQAR
jgi:hypothetical protein